jgi:hypothetical protein
MKYLLLFPFVVVWRLLEFLLKLIGRLILGRADLNVCVADTLFHHHRPGAWHSPWHHQFHPHNEGDSQSRSARELLFASKYFSKLPILNLRDLVH